MEWWQICQQQHLHLSVSHDELIVNSLSELSSPSYIILTRFFRHGMIIVIELALSNVEC